jgi:hypothetical protein
MSNTNTSNVSAVLSALSPEAVSELESHFRRQFAHELIGGHVSAAPSPKATRAKGNPSPRKTTSDGRTASDFIRDCSLDMSPKEVQTAAADLGLEIALPLVYAVRKAAAKKAEAAAAEAAEAKKSRKAAADKKKSSALTETK